MTWFKVDDHLHDHRKVRLAGTPAMGLWVLAGSWAGDNLTDGFVPSGVAHRWDADGSLSARLVEVGLWQNAVVDGESGWTFRGWADYQPTREKVHAERAAARKRMSEGRSKHRGSEDVRANTFGTRSEHPQDVRQEFPNPDPPRPDPEGAAGAPTPAPRSRAKPAGRPDPWCSRHPGGTDAPCSACQNAREGWKQWRPETFTGPVSMCGDHPQHRTLGCPDCRRETAPGTPAQIALLRGAIPAEAS